MFISPISSPKVITFSYFILMLLFLSNLNIVVLVCGVLAVNMKISPVLYPNFIFLFSTFNTNQPLYFFPDKIKSGFLKSEKSKSYFAEFSNSLNSAGVNDLRYFPLS